MQESAKTKEELEKQKKELTDVKKESHKRKKLLIAQQHLIHAGSGSYNKVLFDRYFVAEDYVIFLPDSDIF